MMSDVSIDPTHAAGVPPEQRTARKLFDKAPGHIAAVMRNGATAQGARLVRFSSRCVPIGLEGADEDDYRECGKWDGMYTEDIVNDYFSRRGNLIALEMWPASDGTGDILALIGTTFDESDMEEWEEIQRVVDREMKKYREAKANEKAKAELAAKEAEKQVQLDAEVGRKVREHNLLGKLRELEAEVQRLKAAKS
jgi:hypothetical protein